MTASQYPISDTNPVPIAQDGTGALTIFNESTTGSVILSETPNPNAGYSLGPGNIITLDGGKPLYASIPSGGVAVTISVIDNGGTISSASAIAQQILSQGLATDIATEISLNGAPPIDVNDQIYGGSHTSDGLYWVIPDLDVHKYQSVTVVVYEEETVTNTDPTVRTGFLRFNNGLIYQDTVGFAFSGTNNNTFGGLTVFTTVRAPVTAPTMGVQLNVSAQTGTRLSVYVLGSYKALPAPAFVDRSAYWLGASSKGDNLAIDGVQSWRSSPTGAGETRNYPSSAGGPAAFTVNADLVTTGGAVRLVDALDRTIVYASTVLAASASEVSFTTLVQLPNRPVCMVISAPVVATNLAVTLAYRRE